MENAARGLTVVCFLCRRELDADEREARRCADRRACQIRAADNLAAGTRAQAESARLDAIKEAATKP